MATLQFTEGASVPESFLERKQLLNHIVDGLANTCPYGVWAEIPKSSTNYDAGFRRVTYRELSNAVNGAAWWLSKSLGQGESFETLAYIGLWDIRYVVLLLAAVKAGYKVSPSWRTVRFCSRPANRWNASRWSSQVQSIAWLVSKVCWEV